MNVQLSEESRRFIATQVATGRYPSENAVLEDALSLMRQRERPPQPEIDEEAIEYCTREIAGKEIPSLEDVRRALAKIPGSMAQVVIEERGERF
jgi:putative addiction module CopG family antidote